MPSYNSGNYFLRNATETATAACEDFLAWVAHFNGDFSQDAEASFDSLFAYFEAWIAHKKEALNRTFADGSGTPTWDAFESLLPCIYIGVIDRILVNPAHLDYLHTDPLLGTSLTIRRPMRRVSWLAGDGDDHEANMDGLLDWVRPPAQDQTSEGYNPAHPGDDQCPDH